MKNAPPLMISIIAIVMLHLNIEGLSIFIDSHKSAKLVKIDEYFV
jgi:hypothetical protein